MMIEDLAAGIKAVAAVAAILGTNVYGVQLPQKGAPSNYMPGLVYQIVSASRPDTMQGFKGFNIAKVQMMCIAMDYKTVRQLADAVRKAFDGFSGAMGATQFWGVFLDTERDMYEPDALHYRVDLDFKVIHREP